MIPRGLLKQICVICCLLNIAMNIVHIDCSMFRQLCLASTVRQFGDITFSGAYLKRVSARRRNQILAQWITV